MAARPRVVELGEALVAGKQVRRNMDTGFAVPGAREDAELATPFARHRPRLEELRRGSGRRLRQQGALERPEPIRRPLDDNVDLAAVVSHPAGKLVQPREAINERPEADALYASADAQTLGRMRRRRARRSIVFERRAHAPAGSRGAGARRCLARWSGVQACGVR